MSNPGPASTQTDNFLMNGNASDGISLGIATGKIGFYGETPVVQAAAITALTAGPTTAEFVSAINSLITAVKNIGITA